MPAVAVPAESEGVAHGDHPIADPHLLEVAPAYRRQRMVGVDLQHREVGLVVFTEQACRITAAIL